MGEDAADRTREGPGGGDPAEESRFARRSSLPDGSALRPAGSGVPSNGVAGPGGAKSPGDTPADPRRPTGEAKGVSGPGDGEVVSLVGAGPGHPGLLTRRARDRLAAADVVLHDSLAGEEILELVPDAVEVIDVGKRPPGRTSQDEINGLMRERAGRGERVVRLKGGDPCVFGRGGEEAEYLAAEGIAFEIVPGVSSVLAAASASGIPLTHRDRASSVTVITGHETPEKGESAIDWGALAEAVAAGGTLVVLMGVRRLPENVRALREQGLARGTPAAMVQKATWRGERTVVGTLADIVERSRAAGIEPPAVTIIGEVVEVREEVEPRLLG